MILFSRFGYALRHQIGFDTKAKHGSLRLWSYYDGSGIGADPLANGKGSLSELLAHQFAVKGALFGANYSAEFPLGGDQDVLALLAAITQLRSGKEFSFSNYEDRMISFFLRREEKQNKVIILVKIRYSNKIGQLTPEEANELEVLTSKILSDFGYSTQQIAERLESIIGQSSNQVL